MCLEDLDGAQCSMVGNLTMEIPVSLGWLNKEPNGDRWLAELPDTLDAVLKDWNLQQSGPPFDGGMVAYTLPVQRGDQAMVLKLQWPHNEAESEADALLAWRGKGAVQLIDHDRDRHALLLEACRPGTYLADAAVDPVEVMTRLLPQLWIVPDGPFPSLAQEAREWADRLPTAWERAGRPCERSLIDAALNDIAALAETQVDPVLLHQDLHGHNVLAAEREPWLAIDPKPLLGERAFGLAPIVRSFEFVHSAEATLDRLDRLSAALDLDRERALGWTVAQTMAWGFGGAHDAHHQQTVRWLLAARAGRMI